MSATNAQGQDVVTAVIVAHDGASWLPRVAESLLNQTRPVQRVVAVDTGSRDRSGAILADLLGRSVVFGMDRGTGYGAAIGQALRHRAANTHVPGPAGLPQDERVEWVWLLHDDCEPASDALEQLLSAAAEARSAAVLGPKIMDWADRRVILEAGITTDTAGRRISGIEPREIDQGQHDGDRDVMAVSSAGMLVRRDVWEQVGGFDPGMRLRREDIDFCWRVHAAGHRVRVATGAVVYHLEASARNRRVASAASRPRRADRRNALITLLGNLPAGPALSALLGNMLLSAARTAFFLLVKRPRDALDEVAAVTSVVCQPLRLLAVRRVRARGRRAAFSRLRGDLPPGHSVRRLAEYAASVFYKSSQLDTAGSHHATDDPYDDESLLIDNGLAQRIFASPAVWLFVALVVTALVAERSLLGSGPLAGGALTPAWGGASALWHEYTDNFHAVGIGSATAAPPYVALIALLASVLGGKPWLAIDLIILGCVPLAGMSAFFVARRITKSVAARVWAGAAYAMLPIGMGAVAGGRFGSAVAFALLPTIALLAARIFTETRTRARRAAWATGLVIAIATAFVPLVWVVAVLAAVLTAAAFARKRAGVAVNIAIAVLVPPVLLLPWTLELFTNRAQFFLEAGLQGPGLASSRLPARSLLMLSPGGPGLPPYWVTAGLILAALAALLTRRRRLVLIGWSVALLGLLTAVLMSRLLVTPQSGGEAVPAWPGIALAIAAVGMLLAAVAAADGLPGRLRDGRWRRPRGLVALALAVVACTAPLLAAVSWLAGGVRGPVKVSAGPVLPPFVAVSAHSATQPRTLVLRTHNGAVSYEVLRGADPLIGASALTAPAPARQALSRAVATLAAPNGGDVQNQGQSLAALGVGYVLLPGPVNAGLARTLDGVAALRPVSKTVGFQLWRVAATSARARVVEHGGKVLALPSGPVSVTGATAPQAGGTLVLAEPAGGWSATLNGTALKPLPAPVDGWAQGFTLPPGGGRIDVSHSQLGRDLIVAIEALAFLAVAALGLPGVRTAGEAPAGATGEPRAAGRRRERVPETVGVAGPEQEELQPETAAAVSSPAARSGAAAATGRPSRRAVSGEDGGLGTGPGPVPPPAAVGRRAGPPGRRSTSSGGRSSTSRGGGRWGRKRGAAAAEPGPRSMDEAAASSGDFSRRPEADDEALPPPRGDRGTPSRRGRRGAHGPGGNTGYPSGEEPYPDSRRGTRDRGDTDYPEPPGRARRDAETGNYPGPGQRGRDSGTGDYPVPDQGASPERGTGDNPAVGGRGRRGRRGAHSGGYPVGGRRGTRPQSASRYRDYGDPATEDRGRGYGGGAYPDPAEPGRPEPRYPESGYPESARPEYGHPEIGYPRPGDPESRRAGYGSPGRPPAGAAPDQEYGAHDDDGVPATWRSDTGSYEPEEERW
ncbi:MAG TPA: glycosyltransferase [Streptosporangiaceae bacterium]|nr:glycosyltransferase [Streptosporangiaceae bacterium]